MESLTHVPSGKRNIRTKRLISSKCLIYRRQKLIPQTMNIHQESLPILKPMNLLLGFWLDSPLFALFDHKNSSSQTINRFAHSLL